MLLHAKPAPRTSRSKVLSSEPVWVTRPTTLTWSPNLAPCWATCAINSDAPPPARLHGWLAKRRRSSRALETHSEEEPGLFTCSSIADHTLPSAGLSGVEGSPRTPKYREQPFLSVGACWSAHEDHGWRAMAGM